MNVFLTGGTGLLGINTVNALLSHGHRVLVLARDGEKARRVLPAAAGVTVVPGDIERADDWIARLGEADALVHAAAYFREYFGRGDHAARLAALNVDLPVRLARAAGAAGLKKAVVVSSSLALGPRADGTPAGDDDPPRPGIPANAYARSKVAMELALREIQGDLACPLVVVRPGWMFGPNDSAPTAAGELVRTLVRTRRAQVPTGAALCIADARDVADGIVRALERCDAHAVYNLAGRPRTAVDALREVARHVPGGASVQSVPAPAALALSALLEPFSRLRGVPNPIPRLGVLTISRGYPISSGKAERELGVTFRPFPDTARDTAAYFAGG